MPGLEFWRWLQPGEIWRRAGGVDLCDEGGMQLSRDRARARGLPGAGTTPSVANEIDNGTKTPSLQVEAFNPMTVRATVLKPIGNLAPQ
jgi:hypothetical protein